MTARQLQLFEHPGPWLSLFEAEFFRAIPRSPGVYIMTGKAERVLYVGQSRNLRQRLYTYKNCNPNHLPRRIIRLIHQVEKISWETCESPRAARLRENQLLRLHRPKFNVMNVYPRAYPFIGVKAEGSGLTLWLTRQHAASTQQLHGAFKGAARYAFAALARSLWAAIHRPRSIEDFPCGVLKGPRQITFSGLSPQMGGELHALLVGYLDGASSELVDWLHQWVPAGAGLAPFQEQLHAADLALLADFFETGARRNYLVRQQHGLVDHLILQEHLDDYMANSASVMA